MTAKHFIGPGNVYRTPGGEVLVVSYCWSANSIDVLEISGKSMQTRVKTPAYLREKCQFIGQKYKLKASH